MESMFGLDKVSREIALKHGVDYSGIDFKKAISERDKREQQRSIEFTKKIFKLSVREYLEAR
jgi:hypothetical protein